MFDFEKIEKENIQELIILINKIIVDEINYVNKLCFVYSLLKEKYPNKFEKGLKPLLQDLNKLQNAKRTFDLNVSNLKETMDIDNLENVKSLTELQIYADEIIDKDLDKTIDNIVEEVDVNNIAMEDKFNCLCDYDEIRLMPFISFMRNINDCSMDYVSKIVKDSNKKINTVR